MYYEGDVTAAQSHDVKPVPRAVHPLCCKVTSTARGTFVGGQRRSLGTNPRPGIEPGPQCRRPGATRRRPSLNNHRASGVRATDSRCVAGRPLFLEPVSFRRGSCKLRIFGVGRWIGNRETRTSRPLGLETTPNTWRVTSGRESELGSTRETRIGVATAENQRVRPITRITVQVR